MVHTTYPLRKVTLGGSTLERGLTSDGTTEHPVSLYIHEDTLQVEQPVAGCS